jgi:two-component system sensor histidine kinase BarA
MDPDEEKQDDTRPTPIPPRDEVAALAATGGDAQLAEDLLIALVRGLPQELDNLTRQHHGEDWTALFHAAHRMRGATAYCGVPALDNALQQLERAAQSGVPAYIDAHLREVMDEAARLRDAVAT